MTAPRKVQAKAAAEQAKVLTRQSFDVAESGLEKQLALAKEGREIGEPGWMKSAFMLERGALTDTMAAKGMKQGLYDNASSAILQGGGNFSAALTPQDFGAAIAKELYGPRVSEAMTTLNQSDKFLSDIFGTSSESASGQLAFESSRLGSMSMIPGYNPTYAAILGGVNTAGSIWGGFQQRPVGVPSATTASGPGWGGGTFT